MESTSYGVLIRPRLDREENLKTLKVRRNGAARGGTYKKSLREREKREKLVSVRK